MSTAEAKKVRKREKMLSELKERVCEANIALKAHGLITLTWGNVSERDRETGLIAIKPSGVDYDSLKASDIVIIDENGNVVEGTLRPSSDAPTHAFLYRAFPSIGGITHTHSRYATVFAQSGRGIPPLGTTHADAFYGEVPCTRKMTASEIEGDYEAETGTVIAELFDEKTVLEVPAALVHSHGPFCWGADANKSVENAVVLEEVAMMAFHTLTLNPHAAFQSELLDRHWLRKHGKNAYYGQGKSKA